MLTSFLLATALSIDPLALGRMQWAGPAGGLVVAAPHGGFDLDTDEMARQAALLAGAGYLLASGYRTHEHPWNVNRPTAGVGLAPDAEARTPEAARVFDGYMARLDALHPALYVELHGNSRPESAGAIEVAAKGIPLAALIALQADFKRRLTGFPAGCPRLPLAIEGLQPIHYHAEGAKQGGAFARLPHALQLEIPRAGRQDPRWRSVYASALGASLYRLSLGSRAF
ncbi:MAG: hypothetical protein JWM80_2736 [Cyanobacteria bacterium RYN_339]|nr:hypothetical protein [Cyanobacteria bacterium RYN_339]